MTVVPLPDVPCVRVRCIWNQGATGEGGIRLYASYSGSAPSGANCATLAADVASAWGTYIVPLMASNFTLNEVDVLDIATDSGLSGQWNGSHAGDRAGSTLSDNCASNIEFNIARRYRGGKPRCFLPPGVQGDLVTPSSYAGSFVSSLNTNFGEFMTTWLASSVGSMGTLAHVNLSYYKGFTNLANSSGRERAVPTYRATALHDNITGYSAKAVIGSQRRRRTSTTP